jgi:hypothetical protein
MLVHNGEHPNAADGVVKAVSVHEGSNSRLVRVEGEYITSLSHTDALYTSPGGIPARHHDMGNVPPEARNIHISQAASARKPANANPARAPVSATVALLNTAVFTVAEM